MDGERLGEKWNLDVNHFNCRVKAKSKVCVYLCVDYLADVVEMKWSGYIRRNCAPQGVIVQLRPQS